MTTESKTRTEILQALRREFPDVHPSMMGPLLRLSFVTDALCRKIDELEEELAAVKGGGDG